MARSFRSGRFTKTVDVDIESSDIEEWLEDATDEQLSEWGLVRSETHDHNCLLGVNAVRNAGNLYDLQQIQELLDNMNLSDILEKLRA